MKIETYYISGKDSDEDLAVRVDTVDGQRVRIIGLNHTIELVEKVHYDQTLDFIARQAKEISALKTSLFRCVAHAGNHNAGQGCKKVIDEVNRMERELGGIIS